MAAPTTARPTTTPARAPDVAGIQRRTLAVLVSTQVLGGLGVGVGLSMGVLFIARLTGPGWSGLGQSANVVGAALLALPISRLMTARGRRPGLTAAYLIGGTGAGLAVLAAVLSSVPLAFLAFFLFGGATTANLLARYTAVDLAEPARRARQLSLVVWATTVGAVVGPNLAPAADAVFRRFGLPDLAGPFVFSTVGFLLAAVVMTATLRPDPLLTARAAARSDTGRPDADPGPRQGFRAGLADVWRRPVARLGLSSMAVGHVVMVAVMVMTPVQIDNALTADHVGHADVLRVVGLIISGHVAGMFGLSPLVGWAADRWGRRPMVVVGVLTLLVACALAGTAGPRMVQLGVGLTLLGLGWSATSIAGSTLLTDAIPADRRPAAQGLGDLMMGLAGATAGALAGLVVALGSYPVLCLVAALTTVPLLGAALRRPPAAVPAQVS